MLQREFLTYAEAVGRIGDAETFRQSLIHSTINGYIEVTDIEGTYLQHEAEKPKAGHTRFASWYEPHSFRSKVQDDDSEDEGSEISYCLTGWYVLEGYDVIGCARRKKSGMAWGTTVSPATDEGGEPFHLAGVLNFEIARGYELRDLWFRARDVERLMDGKSEEKPLDPRERTTLLCIIGALASSANLDLSQPMKAGEAIAAMMLDVKLTGRAIGEHLKKVTEAMDSRRG